MSLAFEYGSEKVEADVIYTVAFFEDPREVGEVVYNGARYRVVYDPKTGHASCVLVPGQDEIVGPTVAHYGHA